MVDCTDWCTVCPFLCTKVLQRSHEGARRKRNNDFDSRSCQRRRLCLPAAAIQGRRYIFYWRISCPSLNFLLTTLPIKGSAFCILNQWFPVRTCRFPWNEDSHQRQFKDGLRRKEIPEPGPPGCIQKRRRNGADSCGYGASGHFLMVLC